MIHMKGLNQMLTSQIISCGDYPTHFTTEVSEAIAWRCDDDACDNKDEEDSYNICSLKESVRVHINIPCNQVECKMDTAVNDC